MMESFFDISKDSVDVFSDLAIMSHPEFCSQWMNQYPVIFISLKDVESLDFDGAYGMLRYKISDLCIKLDAQIKQDSVNPDDWIRFCKLKSTRVNIEEVKNSLFMLTRMMSSVYSKPVILLIDEYDVPLAKAQENGYYREMLDTVRGMFSVALKTNDYLKFAVVTGCLRISKESIFTGVNNFSSYSVLDNRFSNYFGFSSEEVGEILKKANMEDKAAAIRTWYDGYMFGHSAVYCPWDVIRYVSDLLYDKNAQPQNYWKNTSGNGILREFIENTEMEVSEKFEELMNGGTIMQGISQELTYDQLYCSEENLWSVLLMTGYVTRANQDDMYSKISLRIPNKEIASIFQDTVVDHFQRDLNRDMQREMVQALWNEDEILATKLLSDFLWQTISNNDYHEDYYHAFITGIFVGLGYAVESNKEHGMGRPDVLLKDRKNRRALIIETKKARSESDMLSAANGAAAQIRKGQYWRGLEGYRTVICYGISFYKKDALVKKMV